MSATIRTTSLVAELVGAIGAGFVAAAFGLRAAVFIAPAASVLAAWYLWRSPVRHLRAPAEPASRAHAPRSQVGDGRD